MFHIHPASASLPFSFLPQPFSSQSAFAVLPWHHLISSWVSGIVLPHTSLYGSHSSQTWSASPSCQCFSPSRSLAKRYPSNLYTCSAQYCLIELGGTTMNDLFNSIYHDFVLSSQLKRVYAILNGDIVDHFTLSHHTSVAYIFLGLS